MDLNEIKKLIKTVDESNINELEIEQKGTDSQAGIRVRITKIAGSVNHVPHTAASQTPVDSATRAVPQQTSASESISFEKTVEDSPAKTQKESTDNLIEVNSPIVGTFYGSPAPDADAYVSIGSTVKPGQTLCIVEAMKIMNEIEAEVEGKVVKVLVENGQPVEYGQTLFLLAKP